ncbi:hypothetical protein FGO68_gene792 [Halteria grandinella]|uniref:TLDc domain-containing protein n=1 Tax=Halteria grandinella TaxID=5974 RepID=A0A8J8NR11_HALGN|nr:hypothetical protein FGO68_gene792 [Halteria grandinella]
MEQIPTHSSNDSLKRIKQIQERLDLGIQPIIDSLALNVGHLLEAKGTLFNDSQILLSCDQIAFVLSVIPNQYRPSKKISLLYRASRDGWYFKDFHRLCDNQGPTIVLIKCRKGRVCGGYSRLPWTSPTYAGVLKPDKDATIFSVDYRQAFPVLDKNQAVFHHHACGPNFGNGVLRLYKEPMNCENGGGCYCEFQTETYRVAADHDGNSVMTGEGKSTFSCFTCKELEVYLIK